MYGTHKTLFFPPGRDVPPVNYTRVSICREYTKKTGRCDQSFFLTLWTDLGGGKETSLSHFPDGRMSVVPVLMMPGLLPINFLFAS